MSNRASRQSGKNRREQAVKSENKAWRDARLQQGNMNLTRPGKRLSDKPKYPGRWDS